MAGESRATFTIPDGGTPPEERVPDGATGDARSATIPLEPQQEAEEPKKQDERPAWLPEKFKTPEDMAKAYAELEKKQGAAGRKEEAPDPAVDAQSAAKAGVDLEAVSQEFIANGGELSKETRTALNEKGFSDKQIDTYIAGQKALAEKVVNRMVEIAGNEETFRAALDWAGAEFSDEEKQAYHASLAVSERSAELAFRGLLSRFREAEGTQGSRVRGERVPGVAGAKPFEDMAEMLEAMRDPRYDKSEAYRKKVRDRIAVTEGGLVRTNIYG